SIRASKTCRTVRIRSRTGSTTSTRRRLLHRLAVDATLRGPTRPTSPRTPTRSARHVMSATPAERSFPLAPNTLSSFMLWRTNRLGYNTPIIDCILGQQLGDTLTRFQNDQELESTGELDAPTRKALEIQ